LREVAVVGVGVTKVAEHWERSLRDLFVEASLKAAEDAGISLRDLDAVYVANMSSGYLQGQEHLGSLMSTWLGVSGIAACKVEAACASGGVAFHQGFLAVASGLYDYVLIGGVEKMSDAITPDILSALIMADDQEYVASTGATFVGLNALVYRAYMEKYKVKQEDIALLAVHDHAYAVNNPYAQFRNEITLEQVLSSPLVADPIHLLESSPTGDGAAAIILAPLEKVKRCNDVVIEVAASRVAVDHLSLNEREDITTMTATIRAAREAYKMAKIDAKDVDVVEMHDAFTALGIINLEDLGFAEKGKGALMVKEGEIEKGGRKPTNLFGGLKARGHPVGATGLYQIVEIVWQLRGQAGKSQVEGAEIGLAQNIGGVGSTVSVNILRRVR